MLDISKIKSVREARIELRHPVTNEQLGAFIALRSGDHPERRRALMDYQRLLRKIGEGDQEEQVNQRHEAHVQYIASCISAWEGISEDSKKIPFSTAAAVNLLMKPEMDWLLTQISLQLLDGKNFIAAQPKA